jgi:hypothetical protein
MSSRGLAPTLIFTGAVATASGILAQFRLEHASFDGSNAALIGVPLTVVGLLVTGVGVGTWARRASPLRVFLAAVCIGVGALVIAEYGHLNFHGWTAIFYFVVLAGGAGAILLLVAAATRL